MKDHSKDKTHRATVSGSAQPDLPQYKDHALTVQLLPPVSEEQVARMAKEIQEQGLLVPVITIHENAILDGRVRYRAAIRTNTPFEVKELGSKEPVQFLLGGNLCRSRYTTGQLAAIAVELANLGVGDVSSQKPDGVQNWTPCGLKYAGDRVGVSRSSAAKAKRLKAQSPELFGEVKSGTMTLEQACREARGEQDNAEEDAETNLPDDVLQRAEMLQSRVAKKRFLKAAKALFGIPSDDPGRGQAFSIMADVTTANCSTDQEDVNEE